MDAQLLQSVQQAANAAAAAAQAMREANEKRVTGFGEASEGGAMSKGVWN